MRAAVTDIHRKSVLVVEDHVITRLGLNLMLRERSDLRVVGEASDGREAVTMAVSLKPDVVLMDIGLPELDGIEAVWQIKKMAPGTRVLMLTSHEDRDDVLSAIGAGADGYCCKDISLEQLAAAIDAVISGGRWIDPRLSGSNELFAAQPAAAVPSREDNQDCGDRLATRLSFSECNLNYQSGARFADKYVICQKVVCGERGLVFQARNIHNGSMVAIKFLDDDYDFDVELLNGFCSEARALSNLDHPNLVEVVEFGVTNEGRPYLIMEYQGNQTLEAILAAGVALSIQRVVSIFRQILDGLDSVHNLGRIHGDLRPACIILTGDREHEQVKLSGCGLVLKKLGPLTRGGKIKPFAQPFYMCPEGFSGGRLDFLSDIYSVAAVMYHALYGVPVFSGNSYVEVCQKHLLEKPCFPPTTASGEPMPLVLEDCLNRALSKTPSQRFGSAAELRMEISKLCHSVLEEDF